jgi:hypothetical protein
LSFLLPNPCNVYPPTPCPCTHLHSHAPNSILQILNSIVTSYNMCASRT